MKIGCCVNMVSTQADGTGIEWAPTLAAYGYDYIELPLAQMMALDDSAFAVLKRRLRASGLPCEACNNFFPAGVRLTGEATVQKHIEDYVARAFDRAAELGVQTIVFGSGQAKNVPPGYPTAKAWQQLVDLLRFLDPLARIAGLVIAVEPLCKLESNIINTAAEGLKMVTDVDRKNIRLLVDYYHLAMEKEDLAIIPAAGAAIRHVHFARPEGRKYPLAADGHDYLPFLKTLVASGYNGGISLEAYSQDFRQDAGQAIALVRQLISSAT